VKLNNETVAWGKRTTYIVGIYTIITLGIFCVSFYGLKLTRESNRINRDSFAAVQRPFVISKGLDVIWTYDTFYKKELWIAQPIWENVGNTPTRDLQLYMNWCPRIDVLPSNFTYPDLAGAEGQTSYTPLGPHQTKYGPLTYSIGAQPMSMIQQHKALFYFYGWAKYHDTLHPKVIMHRTNFCYVNNDFVGNPLDRTGTPIVRNCNYECADSECDRQPIPKAEDSGACGIAFITARPGAPDTTTAPKP
jgi:hypothetical protein